MTPLKDILQRQILATGPLRLSDYMRQCLFHPDHGYYTTKMPFGSGGDFVTAPDISQMFGELIGLCLAQHWLTIGSPERFTLAELGPGRGALMADMLRATKGVPGFHAAMQITMIEASAALASVQAQRIAPWTADWRENVADLPEAPLFLVANEFLDALPIRQFQKQPNGWRETLVGVVDGDLRLGHSPLIPDAEIGSWPGVATGQVVELCPELPQITAQIAGRLSRHGGMALIIDYGGWNGIGDTFQALQAHRPVDPMAAPGAADLTAHVDFCAVARAAGDLSHAYTTQGQFLTRLGIRHRAEVLSRGLSGKALENHQSAHARLTLPSEMGELFKVLALYRPGDPCPVGFDDA